MMIPYTKYEFLICDDINIDHLNENSRKIETHYEEHIISHTINFATRTKIN
jgi:hypothetical protein